MPLGVAVEGRAVKHRLIHASRLVREAVSRLMCSRTGHMLNFLNSGHINGPLQRVNTAAHWCNQHKVDVTAGLQVLMQ